MKKHAVFAILFSFYSLLSFSQNGFTRWDTLKVEINGANIRNPWAGGVNCPQFSEIDLDGDGIKDLFLFDRSSSRVLTFINKGTANTVDYEYAHAYEKLFPAMHDFALLADYNCDGKDDIFTYSNGGMAVYRNDYSVANGLVFAKMTDLLLEQFGASFVNLYVAPPNLPAIADIDGDGDLDILSLAVAGAFVEYHKNISMEVYGTCDSLAYKYEAGCWGNIALSSSNTVAAFGITCRTMGPSALSVSDAESSAHSAAALLALDLDGDNDKDLVVSDMGFNNLLSITNGGTATVANMVAQDEEFPMNNSSTSAVQLLSFPGAYYLDINNDGKKDLIAAPNAANVSENVKGIWYYKNTGTNTNPVFNFMTDSLMQNDMIETGEGNNPVFFDYNNDGLKDLLIGNSGYFSASGIYSSGLSLYKNIGTATNPAFQLITKNYANVFAQGLRGVYPALGDIDGDGDADMIIGDADGKLHLYINTAGSGNTANFILSLPNYFTIDIGNNAAPQLVDLDRDGKLDLVAGRKNGKLSWFKNTGTVSSASFSAVANSDLLGGVDVVDYSYSITGNSTPFIADINGSYKLFVGSERGYIYYYNNIDGNLSGNFTLVDSMFLKGEGSRLSISAGDLNGDNKVDLIIGNFGGGSAIYKNIDFTGISKNNFSLNNKIHFYPNPASEQLGIALDTERESKKIIEIYTIGGSKIFSSDFITGSVMISINTFSNGLYFCKVISPNTTFVGKFVVLH